MDILYWLTYRTEDGKKITRHDREIVKFGFTSNFKQRMSAYRNAVPLELDILTYRPGSYAEEQEFLKRHKHHIFKGEWMYYDEVKSIINEWTTYRIPEENWFILFLRFIYKVLTSRRPLKTLWRSIFR